jgi:hypothetical protein
MSLANKTGDGKVAETGQRLFEAVDEALGPARVPRELSRIIAQFAGPFRWADDPLSTTRALRSASLIRRVKPVDTRGP